MLKHLCIWEIDRRDTKEKKKLHPSSGAIFVLHAVKRRGCGPFTFDDFSAVSEVSCTSLSVCGSDETRTPSPFYVLPARACCCPLASAAPSCTQHEQVTNWYHIMASSDFSLSPSETWDWIEKTYVSPDVCLTLTSWLHGLKEQTVYWFLVLIISDDFFFAFISLIDLFIRFYNIRFAQWILYNIRKTKERLCRNIWM